MIPHDNPWLYSGIYLFGMLALYFVVSGGAYWLFWKFGIKRWAHRKSQTGTPKPSQIRREIGFSIISLFIFTLSVLLVWWMTYLNIGWVYYDFDEYSTTWFVASLFLSVYFHDTWFYWTHRWMHKKSIFKLVHALHHRSSNPTPWATYSFHPLEALVQSMALPVMVMFLPLHPFAIVIFFINQHIYNVQGHLGFENLPSWFTKVPILNIGNTCTHHNLHHHYPKGNYGLYFNVWDRLMKTNQEGYQQEFKRMTQTPWLFKSKD